MMIWSTLSIFGLWIVHRTLLTCENLQIVSSKTMNRIRLISFLTILTFNFVLRDHVLMLFALTTVIVFSPWWLPSIIEKHRENLLKAQFLPLLDQLVLQMNSGRGFRPAFANCIERNSQAIQHTLKEFFSALQYQKEIKELSSDAKIQFFFQELAHVDQSAHKPIDRLKALRRRLMIEKNFRQKSRQALLQVRFQSWVINGMYVVVLIYVHYDFGIQKYFGLVVTSALLFACGLIFVQKMGRRYQWKI